ncbi:MAG: (d)CMP kinase [Gammaproteobacteria bacterium]
MVTIDGPSGTGKGTIARWMSARLGWHLLDSGALYRVLGYAAERAGAALDDAGAVAALAAGLALEFVEREDDTRVILAGEDVTDAIRTEECGAAASRVAAHAAVREALLARQRAFLAPPGLVADGRDMGTVVFPRAALKIFLTASAEERARRRHKQLIEKGLGVNLAQLSRDISERDRRDAERAVSPLKPAADAVILDTTRSDIETVQKEVDGLLAERGLLPTASRGTDTSQ